ncbi:methionine--tRNA ligase [Tepidiforma sp.]|uniref:methionine--tRNA ligase n=1 Tax=Tepidiforma sp. TaxID=2682230 RepID=UPI002616528E|nr:methionine--tRNA ligase [Tepidiforma sp.]MCX7617449.1 methionine--tRNA ligase [Tepidiforma sp.]
MPDRVLVCVAWPYANYLLHVGQAAGAYLPADIFARYQRLRGRDVLMVSGSDCHGTPITVTADREGITPREVVDRYHPKILEVWERFGISFDLYTSTLTENHYAVTQDVFLRLLEQGYLYRRTDEYLFDPEVGRFLPDRYVEGTCPSCGFTEARGDQCDNCGKTLDATELRDPRSKLSGARPVLRPSEHFFLKLSAFEEPLKEWVGRQPHWRRNVQNFTLGMLNEGLKDRAITRDISWGVPVPVPGYEDKRIYVWFDAVIGYLSASKEWAAASGDPEAWRPFWQDGATRSYYFIGKDNIPFHTIIWPAMLLGYGGLNLPYDVPANQYVNFAAGQKQSKSKGTGTWMLDLLDQYDADVIRFYLTTIMPESNDSVFSEDELIRANNDVLIATWGNLANRVISMIHRNFEGVVPAVERPSPESTALLAECEAMFDAVGDEFERCHFRGGLQTALQLAQSANKYLDERAPWKAVKEDRGHAAETLATALDAINALKVLLHPVLPFSTERLHGDLGLPGTVRDGGWRFARVAPGTQLQPARPLYTKIETREAAGT